MKPTLHQVIQTLQATEGMVHQLRRVLLFGGLVAVGTAPFFILLSTVFSAPNLKQVCLYALVLLSIYLIYGSFTYRQLILWAQHFRLEMRFLQHHADEEQIRLTLQEADNLWTPSHTYQLLKATFPAHKWNQTANKALITPETPAFDEHFDETLGRLCPAWMNLSPALWLSLAWLLFRMPDRMPEVVWINYQAWYYIAVVCLALSLGGELLQVFYRVQIYRKFQPLKQDMTAYIFAFRSPNPVAAMPAAKPVSMEPMPTAPIANVLSLQAVQPKAVAPRPETAFLQEPALEVRPSKLSSGFRSGDSIPDLFLPLGDFMAMPSQEPKTAIDQAAIPRPEEPDTVSELSLAKSKVASNRKHMAATPLNGQAKAHLRPNSGDGQASGCPPVLVAHPYSDPITQDEAGLPEFSTLEHYIIP